MSELIKKNNKNNIIIIIGFFEKEEENEKNKEEENKKNKEEEYEEYDEEYEEYGMTHFIGSMDDKIIMIDFYTYSTPCPSGWILGFHGAFFITEIDSENIDSIFSKITHYANKHISINNSSLMKGYYEDDVFSFSENGDDHYYPNGHFCFEVSYFSSIKINKVNFNESIKDEFLNKLFNRDRLEKLVILCNNDLEYLGRSLISIKDITECFIR